MQTEFITNRQWQTYATRLEHQQLRAGKWTYTAGGIERSAQAHIVDLREGQ